MTINPDLTPTVSTVRRVITKVAHSRYAKHPAWALTTMVLIMWCCAVVGTNALTLFALAAFAAGSVWTLKHRRDIAYSIIVAAVTAAAPAVAAVAVIGADPTQAPSVGAIMTAYIVAAPMPTILAWMLPPAGISRTASSAMGSAALLTGVTTVALFGDHGYGPALVAASVAGSCALVWIRFRRAANRRIQAFPELNSWTDLGSRLLPGGQLIKHLLMRDGYVIAALNHRAHTVSDQDLHLCLDRARAVAQTLGIPPSRVKPALLVKIPSIKIGQVRAAAVDGVRAEVAIAPDIQHLTELDPPNHRRGRRALLKATLLPAERRKP